MGKVARLRRIFTGDTFFISPGIFKYWLSLCHQAVKYNLREREKASGKASMKSASFAMQRTAPGHTGTDVSKWLPFPM